MGQPGESPELIELIDGTKITFICTEREAVELNPANTPAEGGYLQFVEGQYTLKDMGLDDRKRRILAIEDPQNPGRFYGTPYDLWLEHISKGRVQVDD